MRTKLAARIPSPEAVVRPLRGSRLGHDDARGTQGANKICEPAIRESPFNGIVSDSKRAETRKMATKKKPSKRGWRQTSSIPQSRSLMERLAALSQSKPTKTSAPGERSLGSDTFIRTCCQPMPVAISNCYKSLADEAVSLRLTVSGPS